MVYFAKFCNETHRITTGSCGLNDWAEQEASFTECVVQTERPYMPDELMLDTATWTIRVRGTDADAAQPPLTRTKVGAILAALREQSHSSDRVNDAIARVSAANSLREIDAILADTGLQV